MLDRMVTTLSDGTAVRLRVIRPEDKPLLAAGLRRLSPESARQRFLTVKPRLTSRELRYLTEIDGIDHVAVVAVLPHDPQTLVAVGRFVRDPERRDEAEVAIVVGDALQGLGLGRTLGLALADEAQARGIRRFTATLLGSNVAARRLFTAIYGRLEARYQDGLQELVLELPARQHPPLAA